MKWLYKEWQADNQYVVTAGFALAWFAGCAIGIAGGLVIFG